ncbi:MAG: hypothetical protein KDC98_25370 [Planctomycetes bacterium]|nr:hypothetical protein [Planctomycetota bacterium]
MRRRAKPRRELFECPHCGADVVLGAKVCRECGSDADTGWLDEEEIGYQSLDLPSGYSDRPDHPGAGRSERLPRWVVVTALVVVVAFAWLCLRWF